MFSHNDEHHPVLLCRFWYSGVVCWLTYLLKLFLTCRYLQVLAVIGRRWTQRRSLSTINVAYNCTTTAALTGHNVPGPSGTTALLTPGGGSGENTVSTTSQTNVLVNDSYSPASSDVADVVSTRPRRHPINSTSSATEPLCQHVHDDSADEKRSLNAAVFTAHTA